jgi:hypothetical protein
VANSFRKSRFTDKTTDSGSSQNLETLGAQALEMAPKVGLEPIEASFFMFSLLLIIAFLCANLYANIQAFPSYGKHYFASLCNNRQKNLCGTVRLCGNCAGVEFCAGTVRARLRRVDVGRAGLGVGCLEPSGAPIACRGLAGARGRGKLAGV